MKTLLAMAAFAALAVAAPGDGLSGYACDNHCPLAKQANLHRAYGSEAVAVSVTARADLVESVERNLLRI